MRLVAAHEHGASEVRFAGIAQLVEHNLAKVGVAGSSPVSRFSAWRAHGEIGAAEENVRGLRKVASAQRCIGRLAQLVRAPR